MARLPIGTAAGEFDLRAFECKSGFVYLAVVPYELLRRVAQRADDHETAGGCRPSRGRGSRPGRWDRRHLGRGDDVTLRQLTG
jgi:hypothetical protein